MQLAILLVIAIVIGYWFAKRNK